MGVEEEEEEEEEDKIGGNKRKGFGGKGKGIHTLHRTRATLPFTLLSDS